MKRVGDKKRILHFIGGGELGGAEELLLSLMKLLDQEQYEAQLICLCEGPFAQLVADNGFKVAVIPMRHKFDLGTIKPIREYLIKNQIDLVHTHGVRANLVARTAAKRMGLPVVTTFHSVLRYDYDSVFKALIAKYLTIATNKHTDKFIAISGAIKEEIRALGVADELITVIHNGLDTGKYAQQPLDPEVIRSELGLDPNRPTVSMIARLHPVKGHRYFLQAAREILDRGKEAQFLIIGEGIYRGQIERWIQELSLDQAVIMPGYYSPIENIYQVSDLLCVPSLMEGLGLVVLEAMYFKVPVVASNIGGIREIIRHRENGWLVEPRDSRGLAEAMFTLLDDQNLALQFTEAGQQTLPCFSPQRMARQVEETYRSLLGE
ncbi:MAG: glycosyltransferase family 4 protein [Syntrophomonadaceae bacterium]|jgi:glycosyltransferase involved in cell wall biosynthesis|nr:glycosyltransferase family 4 protein [Syntrophomonadaceae bacterium]